MSSPESTPEPPSSPQVDISPDEALRGIVKPPLPQAPAPASASASRIPRTLLLASAYASISGLLFGYQMGVTGGALHSLQSSLDLTAAQSESVSSLFFIGLMIASPFGGYACDRLGRRSSILYMDGAFLLASFVLTLAPTFESFLAGRFVAGCASGISLVAAVSYLTELASAEPSHSHRGALVSAVEASVSLGFLVSYLASYALTVHVDYEEGWRLLFGTGTGLLALIQWLGMRRMPESPEWLAEQGFHDKAHAALRRITPTPGRDDLGDDQSLAGRVAEVEAEVLGRSEQRVPLEYGEVNFFLMDDCPAVSHYWRQAIIIAILAIAEQFCGHINIINYAPVIFAEVFYNYDEEEASENGSAIASELLTTTIILGLVKFLITTFVLFEVDKLGRHFLLKAGAGLVTVSLLFLAVGFTVQLEDAHITDSGATELVHSRLQEALVLIGCSGVVAGFALSYGPITWIVTSELSPSSIRGRLLGFYTVLTHGCAAVVSYTFLSGQERYGEAYPFWLYFFCSLASFAFIVAAVPETGGVTGSDGEDVESLLDDTLFWSKDNPLYRCCRPLIGTCHVGCNKNNTQQELGRIDSCFDEVEGAIIGRRYSLT